MNNNPLFDFSVNKESKNIHVKREFNADLDSVWKAWTTAELLDQWWGPKPWNAETKTMNFTTGGYWLYAMVGPNGEKHWSNIAFTVVDKYSFEATSIFSDENGVSTPGFPAGYWRVSMKQEGDKTIVDVNLSFDDVAGLEQMVAMGFKGGFSIGLQQLDDLLLTLINK